MTELTIADPSARERLEIIRRTRTIAILGMSTDPSRASYFVATYLLSSTCSFEKVWFVNPRPARCFGATHLCAVRRSCPSPDLVDVFRRRR